jgi:hypothetical protein
MESLECLAPANYSGLTMMVSGRIFALEQYPDDSYLGYLRLRILETYVKGSVPASSGPPGLIGRPLAEMRLDACGWFAVCVEYAPAFVLEVTATDWTSCQQDYSAETLLPGSKADDQSHRYVAYSPVYHPELNGCQWQKPLPYQYIDSTWHYASTIAAAFFPATMVALDMREFMALAQPTGAGVDISHENYRAHFRYPETGPRCFTDPPTPMPTGPADACFRNPPAPGYIYLQKGYAELWDVVTHEYGHDAHDALGFGWDENDTTLFPEGVADFIRGVKEDIGENSCGHYRRGGCYGLPRGLFGCGGIYMEQLPTPPFISTREVYTAWLFDIWDESEDDMTDVPAKCPQVTPPLHSRDKLSIPLGEMWPSFATPYATPSTPFPGPARSWVKAWINGHGGTPTWRENGEDWRNLLTVSLHHGVYTDCVSFPVPSP